MSDEKTGGVASPPAPDETARSGTWETSLPDPLAFGEQGFPPGPRDPVSGAAQGTVAAPEAPSRKPDLPDPDKPEKFPPGPRFGHGRGKPGQPPTADTPGPRKKPPSKLPKKDKKERYAGRRAKAQKDQIIRVERLESALASGQSEIDPEAVVSMYLPHRRMKRLGAALLRVGTMRLILLGMVLAVAVLFIAAFMQEKMGNFTINLNRLELYRRGISIASDGDFTDATARLTAETVADATNISGDDLPDDLDDLDGNHNGKNYMAYTYYVRNAGKEDLGYTASIKLDASAKGAQQAVRVAVWQNGTRTTYAAPAADGEAEPGCTSFTSDKIVCEYPRENFQVGDVDKYTIVIWMEGDDPQCVDNIVGGSVQFSMNIDADGTDNTNLLVKFIRDIIDTLTGNKPIDAAGTVAPDYYNDQNITWANRRNQADAG
jgi:hypothetical protein